MSRRRPLSILYVGYPLLTISARSAGGAEQMLLTLEREMARVGNRTTTAASAGSHVSGRLLVTGQPVSASDQYETRENEHCQRVLSYLRSHRDEFDLIHDKSGSFLRHAGECTLPMLATLHLPRSFYCEEWLRNVPSNLYFNCVSHSHESCFHDLSNLLGVVQNGISIERFPPCREKRNYFLWLGRICEEKGTHLAIAAAEAAGVPLVIAGQVYPFSYHKNYFEREVLPWISGPRSRVRFVDTPSFSQKVDLLQHARALLLTSTVAETSSLVAMEAMACGTPVVAFRKGAFPEIVASGETGHIAENLEEMVALLDRVGEIKPESCRHRVEQLFTASAMAMGYERLYAQMSPSAAIFAA